MKRIVIIVTAAALSLALNAQKIEVVSTAGDFNTSTDNSLSLSWTLGETIIPNYVSQDGSISLAHGFQSKLLITHIIETITTEITATVYPNPASEIVRLAFSSPIEREMRLSVINSQGRIVINKMVGAGVSVVEVNLQFLPSGLYFFRLQQGAHINVYRVVKL